MRIPLLIAIATLTAIAIPANAKNRLEMADKRADRDEPEYYGPATPFNPAEARALLAEGKGTIRGYLYHTINDQGGKGGLLKIPSRSAVGVKVYLYPVTAHLVEWQQLYTKEQAAKTRNPLFTGFKRQAHPRILKFDPRMQDYQLVATTDSYGRFTFEKMLPGKYYITSAADITGSYAGTEVTGHSTVYDGWGAAYGVEHTRPTTYNYATPVFMEKFIELLPGQAKLELDAKLK